MEKSILVAGLLISLACGIATQSFAEESDSKAPATPTASAATASQNAPMEAMSAEFMRKVMETSAKIEAMKKEISDREHELFETHPEVHAMRSQMVEIQKTINRILDQDQELIKLKMERDILWSVMPTLPKPTARSMPPSIMRNP